MVGCPNQIKLLVRCLYWFIGYFLFSLPHTSNFFLCWIFAKSSSSTTLHRLASTSFKSSRCQLFKLKPCLIAALQLLKTLVTILEVPAARLSPTPKRSRVDVPCPDARRSWPRKLKGEPKPLQWLKFWARVFIIFVSKSFVVLLSRLHQQINHNNQTTIKIISTTTSSIIFITLTFNYKSRYTSSSRLFILISCSH